jgi:hypothetical protein
VRDGSPKHRALQIALEPVAVLGYELGGCALFRRYVSEIAVRAELGGDPCVLADAFACKYGNRGSAVHQVMAAMLIRAAKAPREPHVAITHSLMNMGRVRGFYGDPALEPGDASNVMQTRCYRALVRGAEIVARRGARLCTNCGGRLETHNRTGYCGAHGRAFGERARDGEARRFLMRSVAEQLGLKADGAQARRARRRVRRA